MVNSAPSELVARVEALLADTVIEARRAGGGGGYTDAERWSLSLAGGRRVFAKMATRPSLAGWLRREHEAYARLGLACMPELVGWEDDVRPAAVDPRGPRTAASIDAVRAGLDELAETMAPGWFPRPRGARARGVERMVAGP